VDCVRLPRQTPVIAAVVDIGTNTVLLLVARVDASGRIETLLDQQRVPRLGQGVDASRKLSDDAMDRVLAVLDEYALLIAPFHPERVVLFGTSAVRDAANREEFSRRVERRTGHRLEVLSGADEARWTFRGGVSGADGEGRFTVIDIGGGSTEISVGDRTGISHHLSLDAGSVRLTERFFRSDPPSEADLEYAISYVEDQIAKAVRFPVSGTTLVGVAGTATTLAALDQEMMDFDVGRIAGYRLRVGRVESMFRDLSRRDSKSILALSNMMRGRNDIITAGALILREMMSHLGFAECVVSERGVRYGIALRELQ
jgi:exopolyphosphatase/guanosine-5'-triphosphate,3'-diphosphate pyrophosphatase